MLYEKLPSPTSTRLINLLPGAPDAPLECELLVIDLESDHVQYPAVSYVWGDPSDKKPIQRMNEILMIPSSLHAFLKVCRAGEKALILWADAICINQSEDLDALSEREHQVGMMGTIFSQAEVVLVYLGEEPRGFGELISMSSALLKLLADESDPQLQNLDCLQVPAFEAISPHILDTFDEIMFRPWYQRVWTFQEFVLARDLKICIGTWAIEYDFWRATSLIFDQLYSYLASRRHQEQSNNKHHYLQDHRRFVRQNLYRSRDVYEQGNTMSLSNFIEATLQLNATNERDRLYGGYGILDRSVMQTIPVDYSISSRNLSQQLSALLLAEGNFTFILQHCAGLNNRVPTWCIRLDSQRLEWRKSYGSTIALFHRLGVYSAAGKSTQSSSIMLAESSILAVSGCLLEKIESVTSPVPPVFDESDVARIRCEFLAIADWTESTLLWLGEVHGLPAGKQLWYKIPTQVSWSAAISALWRTLIGDVLYLSQVLGNTMPSETKKVLTRSKPDSVTSFLAWLHFCHEVQQDFRSEADTILSTTEDLGKRRFNQSWWDWASQLYVSAKKRVGAMSSKRLALLPSEAEVGDEICIFEGVDVPFVLRSSGEHYMIVGSCYLHGMMDGEALERDDWKPTRILIE